VHAQMQGRACFIMVLQNAQEALPVCIPCSRQSICFAYPLYARTQLMKENFLSEGAPICGNARAFLAVTFGIHGGPNTYVTQCVKNVLCVSKHSFARRLPARFPSKTYLLNCKRGMKDLSQALTGAVPAQNIFVELQHRGRLVKPQQPLAVKVCAGGSAPRCTRLRCCA